MSDKIAVRIHSEKDFERFKERAKVRQYKLPPEDYRYFVRYYLYIETASTLCFTSDKMKFDFSTEDFFEKKGYRIISLEEAMREQQAPEFVRGEEVEVRGIGSTRVPAKYHDTIPGEKFPYIAKAKGMDYYVGRHDIRKLPPVQEGTKKFTREYICEFTDKSLNDGRRLLIEFCEKHGMLEK